MQFLTVLLSFLQSIISLPWRSFKNYFDEPFPLFDSKGNRLQAPLKHKLRKNINIRNIIIFSIVILYLSSFAIYYLVNDVSFDYKDLSSSEVSNLKVLKYLNLHQLKRFTLVGFLSISVLLIITKFYKKVSLNFSFLLSLLAVLPLCISLVISSSYANQLVSAYEYKTALDHWYNGEDQEAIKALKSYIRKNPNSTVVADAMGKIAGSQFKLTDYEQSIITIAELLYIYPDTEISKKILRTLHWNIFNLGFVKGVDPTIHFLEDLKKLFPRDELSPIWIGIPPGIEDYSDKSDGFFNPISIDENNEKILKEIINKVQDDKYVDWAMYLIKDYEGIINKFPNSKFVDLAYLAKAREAFKQGTYSDAIDYYKEFIDLYPNHYWTGEAYYDTSVSYKNLGDFNSFLEYASYATYQTEGPRIINVLPDIALELSNKTSNEIEDIISLQQKTYFIDSKILEFIQYYRYKELLKEKKYTQAQESLKSICTKPINPTLKSKYCKENMHIVSQFIKADKLREPEKYLELAMLYLENEYMLIIENSIYNPNSYNKNTPDYFYTSSNNYISAIDYLDKYLTSDAPKDLMAEAYCLKGDAMRGLSLTRTFLPDNYSQGQDFYRQHANELYSFCETNAQSETLKYDAAIKQPLIYLDNYHDIPNAVKEFNNFINKYPNHDWANNAAIWIPRLYLMNSSYYGINDENKKLLLEAARLGYIRVLKEYPDGHVGREAQSELDQVINDLYNLD